MTRPVKRSSLAGELEQTRKGVDSLARRPKPTFVVVREIKVFADWQTVVAGDGAFIFAVSQDCDGLDLIAVELYVTTVSSSGIVQAQVRNITQAADMLSTRIQVDANEFHSKDAATPYVIDTANDDVVYGDRIAIDVDAAGTGAEGLGINLYFGKA